MTAQLALRETFSQKGGPSPQGDADPRFSADPHRSVRLGSLARLAGIGKTYGRGENAVAALSNATLDIRAGEVTLIEGPSGSGKTTLISILGLLLTPTTGEVWLAGKNVAGLGERTLPELRAQYFGFVFQGFNLFPALSALENVAIAIRMKNPRADHAEREARGLLEQVGLAARLHHLPADLSGGQKQRVAIARALGGDPPILIGDEPTAALDTKTALSVMELLRELANTGRAVVVVTHDPRLERFADRVVRVEDGHIQSISPPGGSSLESPRSSP
ncbi:MAG TPA: ABC transporter ATP-binding protein [Kofleriaceae bacterium]|jgi:putative ABC transport system ATP-binding protein|nr:ABC transporter ATP-binding protein [Kofleriaceae bacterium]